MENRTVVITGNKDQELLREKTDIQRNKIREIFLYHGYPWREKDPYENDFIRWTLDDTTLGKKVNAILYERRNAVREDDKKKAKHLKNDLSELGIVVKDQNKDQYVRKVQE